MAQTFNTKIKQVVLAYKRQLKINVTDSSLKRNLEENPFYPSLWSISDTFDKYNVSNAAYNFKSEEFGELITPFIALVNIPSVGNDFVLVTEITDKKVSYIYDKNRPEIVDKATFIERFANFVLFAETNENSGEKDFHAQLKIEKSETEKTTFWIASIIAMTLLGFTINIPSSSVSGYGILSLLKIMGLMATYLLLIFELDKSNIFVKKLCSVGVSCRFLPFPLVTRIAATAPLHQMICILHSMCEFVTRTRCLPLIR